jgi:hypothetical protein
MRPIRNAQRLRRTRRYNRLTSRLVGIVARSLRRVIEHAFVSIHHQYNTAD